MPHPVFTERMFVGLIFMLNELLLKNTVQRFVALIFTFLLVPLALIIDQF